MTVMFVGTLLVALAAVAQAHGGHGEKCAFQPPEGHEYFKHEAQVLRSAQGSRRKLQLRECSSLCTQCIEIPTYFHLMAISTDGTGTGDPLVPHPTPAALAYFEGDAEFLTVANFTTFESYLELLDEQMTVLNDSFSDTPFYFTFMRDATQLVLNEEDWIRFNLYPLTYGPQMSAAYGIQDLRVLNVYLSFRLAQEGDEEGGGATLGLATFPSFQFNATGDGVYMRYDTLPGGGFPNNDIGYTLPHEVGHWLGLYHVFQNNAGEGNACTEANDNDRVDDTPTMLMSTQDNPFVLPCQEYLMEGVPPPDTCPDLPGADPIFNWMNYVETEECFVDTGHFTCGQLERMWTHWSLYRDATEICGEGEAEVTMIIDLRVAYGDFYEDIIEAEALTPFPVTWSLQDETGTVLFDSTTDYSAIFVWGFSQEVLALDMCLDISVSYTFTLQGENVDGIVEITQNDAAIAPRDGDFGDTLYFDIASMTAAPIVPTTPSPTANVTISPAPTPPVPTPPAKGKGKGKGMLSSMYMMYKGKGMMPMTSKGYKGSKGKGKGSRGKGMSSMMSKGKGSKGSKEMSKGMAKGKGTMGMM